MLTINLWLLATAVFLFTATSQAQTKQNKVNYKKNPEWIRMMNDPNANYYETVKAFREFFEDRALPKEPGEMEGHDDFEKQVGLEGESGSKSERERERERELKKQNPFEQNYAFEVRAFKGWFYNTKFWVRADGSIIPAKVRQDIVDKQKNELKEIENANGKK